MPGSESRTPTLVREGGRRGKERGEGGRERRGREGERRGREGERRGRRGRERGEGRREERERGREREEKKGTQYGLCFKVNGQRRMLYIIVVVLKAIVGSRPVEDQSNLFQNWFG